LISVLDGAGFETRGGKGSHRNFVHPKSKVIITISGNLGDDAKNIKNGQSSRLSGRWRKND
jgi:predicted RNA binding protein YcfA (HicA-like mRNA interferase family)